MHIITAGLFLNPSRFAGPPLCGVQRFKNSPAGIYSRLFPGLLGRQEAFPDKVLGNLHGVGGGSFTEIIGNAPEIEPVLD